MLIGSFVQKKIWIGILCIVVIGGMGFYLLRPSKLPVETPEPLITWLTKRGYVPLDPLRGSLDIGCVVRIDDHGQLIAVPAENFDFSGLKEIETSSPNITLEISTADSGALGTSFPGMDMASLATKGVSKIKLEIRDIRIRSYPLDGLGDVIRNHTKLMEVVKREDMNDRLLLVAVEVIEAASLSISFRSNSDAELDIKAEANKIAANLGAEARLGASGEIISNVPVVLGFKGYTPENEALDMAGIRTKFRLTKMSPMAVSKWLAIRQNKPLRVGSEFNICVLAIGLGNYKDKLSGAPASAHAIAERFSRATRDEHVSVLTSKTLGATTIFDKSAPRTRTDILNVIEQFVKEQNNLLKSNQKRLTVFYYCGHGLSEPIAHMPYLVPEDFKARDDETINEAAGRLVALSEIIELLEELHSPVFVMLDMCRPYESDEKWQAGLKVLNETARVNLTDSIDVLRFKSGLSGPHCVVLGSPPGKLAEPVEVEWDLERVGPLASFLVDLFDHEDMRTETWTLYRLTKTLQMDRVIPVGGTVRGYSEIRDDFLNKLPNESLLGPVDLKRAHHTFEDNSKSEASKPMLKTNLGKKGRVLAQQLFVDLDIGKPVDFVVGRRSGHIVCIDEDGNVRSWLRDDVSAKIVMSELILPLIGIDRSDNVFLLDSSTNEMSIITSDGDVSLNHDDVYAKLLTSGADMNSIIVLDNDAEEKSSAPLIRMTKDSQMQIDFFDLTPIDALVEVESGIFVFSMNTKNGLFKREKGEVVQFVNDIESPGAMAIGKNYLFVLNQKRTILYRIDLMSRVVEQCSLDDTQIPRMISFETFRGLRVINDTVLWLATSKGIFRLNLKKANWSSVNH